MHQTNALGSRFAVAQAAALLLRAKRASASAWSQRLTSSVRVFSPLMAMISVSEIICARTWRRFGNGLCERGEQCLELF
jgi:hypothetical protein